MPPVGVRPQLAAEEESVLLQGKCHVYYYCSWCKQQGKMDDTDSQIKILTHIDIETGL